MSVSLLLFLMCLNCNMNCYLSVHQVKLIYTLKFESSYYYICHNQVTLSYKLNNGQADLAPLSVFAAIFGLLLHFLDVTPNNCILLVN